MYSKEEVTEKIRSGLKTFKEKFPIKEAILFGSYATDRYTIASDIDLFILYEGARREDAFALCKRHLAIPGLEPHVYSEAEYAEMKQTIDKMTRNGILLFP